MENNIESTSEKSSRLEREAREKSQAKKLVDTKASKRKDKAKEYAKTKLELSQKDPDKKPKKIGELTKDLLNPKSEFRGAGRLLQLTRTDKLAKRFINKVGGGNYSEEDTFSDPNKDKLKRWFEEKWVDVKTGKPCGRPSARNSGRDYPACRPSVRINADTPKTSGELTDKEKEKFTKTKKSETRIPYTHKKEVKGNSSSYNKNIPKNKKLYEEVTEEAKKKFSGPSAYRSGWTVKTYKERGGEYIKSKDSKHSETLYSTLTDLEKDNLRINGLYKEVALIEDCEDGNCTKTKEYYDALDRVVAFKQRDKSETLNIDKLEEESSKEKTYSAWDLLCKFCN